MAPAQKRQSMTGIRWHKKLSIKGKARKKTKAIRKTFVQTNPNACHLLNRQPSPPPPRTRLPTPRCTAKRAAVRQHRYNAGLRHFAFSFCHEFFPIPAAFLCRLDAFCLRERVVQSAEKYGGASHSAQDLQGRSGFAGFADAELLRE
jgi:hypothetical protein